MPKLIPPPLSLYIHLPWCVRKCPYCDFNSHQLKGKLPEDAYIDAVLTDLEQDLPLVWGRPVISVFLGGGTPSLFTPASVDRLLSGVAARVPLAPGAEVTMEVNPGTVEHGPFAEYRAAGINRLSFGVQSFDDEQLKKLGRVHCAAEAVQAIEAAQNAGFSNVNIDLMFGLPGQTVAEALDDLHQAMLLEPSHVSHYQLTLEPNTLFAKYPPSLPDDDVRWLMQEQCQQAMAAVGYQQYEVSAYAKADQECQHNLNYWRFGDYLGIGAGAHGKITDGAAQTITRLAKLRHPQRYLTKARGSERIGESRLVDADDRLFEFALNALRLNDGFTIDELQCRTGMTFRPAIAPWRTAMDDGLLEKAGQRIKPTQRGRQFLNNLTELFLTDAAG